MPLLTVVIVILVVGALVALINKYGSEYVDLKFIRLINIFVFIAVLIWLAKVIGLWDYLRTITV